MIRGESPQQFLQNLAKTNPQLQGLDLSNPQQTAKELCEKNGEDFEQAKSKVMNAVSQSIAK